MVWSGENDKIRPHRVSRKIERTPFHATFFQKKTATKIPLHDSALQLRLSTVAFLHMWGVDMYAPFVHLSMSTYDSYVLMNLVGWIRRRKSCLFFCFSIGAVRISGNSLGQWFVGDLLQSWWDFCYRTVFDLCEEMEWEEKAISNVHPYLYRKAFRGVIEDKLQYENRRNYLAYCNRSADHCSVAMKLLPTAEVQ